MGEGRKEGREGGRYLHLDDVPLLEGMVEDTRSVDDLPAEGGREGGRKGGRKGGRRER